jgi:hypothetical protein
MTTLSAIADLRPRPREVARAQQILWAWTGWICVYGVFQTLTSGGDAMFAQQLQAVVALPPQFVETAVIVAYVVVALTMAAVVAQIGRGRRWARFSLLISFVFELLLLGGPQDDGAMGYVALILDLGLQAAALYLLYTRPGRDWFAPRRA